MQRFCMRTRAPLVLIATRRDHVHVTVTRQHFNSVTPGPQLDRAEIDTEVDRTYFATIMPIRPTNHYLLLLTLYTLYQSR